MKHAQTIAMARGLLAEGRAADVARMVAPLLEPLRDGALRESSGDPSQVLLRCLLARVRLLRSWSADQALALLEPFESVTAREALPAGVRAEVALWLGWTHTWEGHQAYDDARALNLLDEAERLFREELNANGRCWTLIGQAQAYFTIDECQLMHQALDEAAALQEKLQDALAALWIHDLSVSAARFQGRYAQAQVHLQAFQTLASQQGDTLALGRAHAQQATLHFDLGRSPETIIEEALEAQHLFRRAEVSVGRPLLAAYRAHIRALVRCGKWEEAEQVTERAMNAAGDLPGAPAYLLLQRARLEMIRGRYDTAQALIDDIFGRLHRLHHRLLVGSVALVQAELLECQGQTERALEWAERAHRHARETGHGGHRLQALLHLAHISLSAGDDAAAKGFLLDAERYGDYFSVLPFAALRFRLLGLLAIGENAAEEARPYLAQALSAYSLIGDRYGTAVMQLALAQVGCATDPAQARPLLDAATLTFSLLQARTKLKEARTLLNAWPVEAEGTTETSDAALGASLARAALSVELVAEAWLQAVERLLPDRWIGIYRCLQEGPWIRVHEHGKPPATLTFADPTPPQTERNGVLWLRLRGHPGPAFFFGVALQSQDDPAWQVAYARLKGWLPVVTLALDHALLRAQRLDTAYRLDVAEEEIPELPLKQFVYASPSMRQMAQHIHRIRASHSPVLITGESGTGKELIARSVHVTSERQKAAFLAFNCSNVPHELIDSHLFGHEQGAFTGATRAYPGVIRAADGGTLFLDEIGDLPLDVQPKLLRFLEEGEIFPLGARRPTQVNVRILAATNRDLERMTRERRFREDLYYRLNVIPIRVPPLRDRREEIPLLVRHFLDRLRLPGTPLASITNRALEALLRYDWPGNVRQLRNEIERALVFVGSEPAPLLDLKDLSPAIVEAAEAPPQPPMMALDQILLPGYSLDEVLAETERSLIERVLAEHRGQVTATANTLGLTRQGLYKKMKRLGVDASQFQQRDGSSKQAAVFQLN